MDQAQQDGDLPNVTYLPPSVTSLADCIKHEIEIIESRFQELLEEGDASDSHQQQLRLHEMEELEDALDDGFMCIDLNVLTRKLHIWHDLFSCNGIAVTPYYAIKCNPDPSLVHALAKSSRKPHFPVGYDCASMAELTLAQKQLSTIFEDVNSDDNAKNIPSTRIVYANPQRAEADLMQAFELFASTNDASYPTQDLWLTFDGAEEISKIAKARDNCIQKDNNARMPRIQLIIRIWVPDGHSQVPLGEKFGASLDSIPQLVEACHHHGLLENIIGVSFHCGSGCESVETYQEALQMAQQAIALVERECVRYKSEPHKCWLLDMGGGFPGVDGMGGDDARFVGRSDKGNSKKAFTDAADSSATPTTTVATIARSIRSMLQSFVDDQQLTLIAEPGRYFVEGSAVLASRIYWKRTPSADSNNSEGEDVRVYKIPHGVQGVFKDVILCNEVFVPQPLRISSEGADDGKVYPSKIIGPSGDPEDVVNQHCMLPELKVGDWLIFDRMGAYTMSIASWAGRPMVRYVSGGTFDPPRT